MILNFEINSVLTKLNDATLQLRIRIPLSPWIRIQRYKMQGKAEFNQQIFFGFL